MSRCCDLCHEPYVGSEDEDVVLFGWVFRDDELGRRVCESIQTVQMCLFCNTAWRELAWSTDRALVGAAGLERRLKATSVNLAR